MFSLTFDIPESSEKINLHDSIYCLGSCFSDNIGLKLSQNKFRVETNTFGVIYNPYSIFNNIRSVLSDTFPSNDFIQSASVFFHWDAHSEISHTDRNQLQALISDKVAKSKKQLTSAKWILITLGTAHIYTYNATRKIVANCHKIPQKEFSKRLLSVQEITELYFEVFQQLHTVNPEAKVILTVSPVRHIRDGLVENNHSKAILIQAVQEIVRQDPNAHYFPAYEIMIDELRDYRFYKEDMIHPSEQAIDYVWSKFITTMTDKKTQTFIQKWEKMRKSLAHRPFHPSSQDHQRFLKTTLEKLQSMSSQIDVTQEIDSVRQQIT